MPLFEHFAFQSSLIFFQNEGFFFFFVYISDAWFAPSVIYVHPYVKMGTSCGT